jgi:hypothetical protein
VAKASSFRLDPDLMDELKRRARQSGLSVTKLVERYVDEGLRHESHPLIVFRDAAGGRRPALAGTRLDLAKVIDTVETADGERELRIREAAEYLGVPESHVRACISYYAAFQDEVDAEREREREAAERARIAWERERSILE